MREFKYDDTNISLRYDHARALPPDTIRLWMKTIDDSLQPITPRVIIDLGCGTGRFTGAMARNFRARVLGIDPSLTMLQRGRATIRGEIVTFIQGTAEQLPVQTGVADLVFISMAYHHLPNKALASGECGRVLRDTGKLCLRTSTVECMDSYLWLEFFPAARNIELHRAPTRLGLEKSLGFAGFSLVSHSIVRQRFADNLPDYARKIAQRGLSSLQQIGDDEFRTGLARLDAHCQAADPAMPVYEDIDWFVFAKRPPAPSAS